MAQTQPTTAAFLGALAHEPLFDRDNEPISRFILHEVGDASGDRIPCIAVHGELPRFRHLRPPTGERRSPGVSPLQRARGRHDRATRQARGAGHERDARDRGLGWTRPVLEYARCFVTPGAG